MTADALHTIQWRQTANLLYRNFKNIVLTLRQTVMETRLITAAAAAAAPLSASPSTDQPGLVAEEEEKEEEEEEEGKKGEGRHKQDGRDPISLRRD